MCLLFVSLLFMHIYITRSRVVVVMIMW